MYTLKRKGVNFVELPIIVPEMKGSYVVKYEFDGKEKYAYIVPGTEMEIIYTMNKFRTIVISTKLQLMKPDKAKEKIRCR